MTLLQTTNDKRQAILKYGIVFVLLLVVSCWSLVVASPAFAQEASDAGYLIVCKGADCEFEHLVTLVVRVINLMIFISTILATIVFIWVGFKLMTSGGNVSAKEEAKKALMKVVWGYIAILGAWLLVYTISSALLNEGFFFLGSPR